MISEFRRTRVGRYGSECRKRATVEGCGCLVLDVDDLTRPIREIMREMGIPGFPDGRRIEFPPLALQWTRRGAPAPWATVEMRLELEACRGTAWLRYDVHHASHRTGPQQYPVALVSTPCNFGGVRWWWICPTTGGRVRKLYLPRGGVRFLSRGPGGYNLAYASQRRDKMDQIHARIRRLYARLKADYPGLGDICWPPKPKWMRWGTYEAICDRLEVQANQLDLEAEKIFRRRFRPHAPAGDLVGRVI
jgi:hypothetical protein